MYLFHGAGAKRNTKRGPKRSRIIDILHRQSIQGRHLFARGWEVNWELLVDYLEKNPTHVTYLTDGGDADAPKEYLGAVENGLRNTAKTGTKPMGKLALSSAKTWTDDDLLWRKREAYITACKKILKTESCNR